MNISFDWTHRCSQGTGSTTNEIPKPWEPLASGEEETGSEHASEENPEL